VTDHFIRRRPVEDTMAKKITAFLGLKCFNNNRVDAITTARGYLEFYERYAHSVELLDSAILYLNSKKDEEAAKKQNRDYIWAYYLLNDFQHEVNYAGLLKPAEINDAWTAYRIGEAYFQLQHPDSALAWYKRAADIWKYALDFENKYGICLLALNRAPEAFDVFRFVLNENPGHVSANTNLGFIYMQQGDNKMAYEYIMRAYELDPDYEQNLVNLAVWYHNNNMPAKAKSALEHLLKKHPENERAKVMLSDLAGTGK
jgi:tetratricopeptide (TPR) repeat protein